ncbi:MAG: PUR family DNA/RNA-binding protein [Prevotellaceae bacterium]|jgi:hypothetical protein|nr:PUR family DNA/RNA-binding protein [Prevotellaceae bacterium]
MADSTFRKEPEILFSKAVKAGRRIYYLDVKRSNAGDLFLTITESKKRDVFTDEAVGVTFEKHKIFLYPEDFGKFTGALHDAIDFIDRLSVCETSQQKELSDL